MHRQILCERILKVDHRLKEKLPGSNVLPIVKVVVINVDQRRMVHVLAYHLRQEVAEQAHKPFDVFLASEEDLFSCNSRLPKLCKSVFFLRIKHRLVKHQAFFQQRILQCLRVLCHMCSF